MWGRFRPKRDRRREAIEWTLSALERARGRRLGMLRAKRTGGTAFGNAIGPAISILLIVMLISLSFWLLRRRRARETAPTTSALEEGEEVARPFKSPKGEAEYMAAYEATLRLWPVPYESMDIPGRYGRTHLVATGPKD